MTIWKPREINRDIPFYAALADAIEGDILSGLLQPGERLPTHRDLADRLGIHVTTVTRGYKEAQRRGLIAGTIGRGTFVAIDAAAENALMRPEIFPTGFLEMGLITPLYHLDPDPGDALQTMSRRRQKQAYTQYLNPSGLKPHREAGAMWAARYNLEVSADDMVVCAGAQHALTCCLTGIFKPGQRIAVETLTFPGIKSLAAMLGIKLVPVAMDDQGMIPDNLDNACRREEVKGLYLMPGCQNPTAAKMSAARRDEIAAVALRHNLVLVEDDAYALSCPDAHRPIAHRCPQNSVYLAGVSKVFSAGLRICFAAAPRHLRLAITEAVLNTIWMAPGLNAEMVSYYIRTGIADQTLEAKRREAARRNDMARRALNGHSLTGHPTGFYTWLRLPGPWTGRDFENRMRMEGVNLFCSEKFAVGGGPVPEAVRLSLTGPASMADLARGLEKVGDALAGKAPSDRPIN